MCKKILTILSSIFCFCITACSNKTLKEKDIIDITEKALDYLLANREEMPDKNMDEYYAICMTTEVMEELYTFYRFYTDNYFEGVKVTAKTEFYSDSFFMTKPYLDSDRNVCYESGWTANTDFFVYKNISVSYKIGKIKSVSFFYSLSNADDNNRTFRYIKFINNKLDTYFEGSMSKNYPKIGEEYFPLKEKYIESLKNADDLGEYTSKYKQIRNDFHKSKYEYHGYIIFD